MPKRYGLQGLIIIIIILCEYCTLLHDIYILASCNPVYCRVMTAAVALLGAKLVEELIAEGCPYDWGRMPGGVGGLAKLVRLTTRGMMLPCLPGA
jgi:hypothetical protein